MSKKMGRPPTGKPRQRQVFAYLPPDLADQFMALPSKERTALLLKVMAEQITKAQEGTQDASKLP